MSGHPVGPGDWRDVDRWAMTDAVMHPALLRRHLDGFAGRRVAMLEIGPTHRRIWCDALGPLAVVVAASAKAEEVEPAGGHGRVGDVADPAYCRRLVDEFGPFDIVLDNMSRAMDGVITTFETIYPTLARGGVYIMAQAQAAYDPAFQGGLRGGGSIVDYFKDLIDELNASHSRGRLPPTAFSRGTFGLCAYDGVLVVERG